MIPALAGVFSKLDGLTRFLAPFLPAPPITIRPIQLLRTHLERRLLLTKEFTGF
jgi:hypothetical protein